MRLLDGRCDDLSLQEAVYCILWAQTGPRQKLKNTSVLIRTLSSWLDSNRLEDSTEPFLTSSFLPLYCFTKSYNNLMLFFCHFLYAYMLLVILHEIHESWKTVRTCISCYIVLALLGKNSSSKLFSSPSWWTSSLKKSIFHATQASLLSIVISMPFWNNTVNWKHKTSETHTNDNRWKHLKNLCDRENMGNMVVALREGLYFHI